MRRRRSLILAVLILLAAVGTAAGGVGALLKREPDFYCACTGREESDPHVAPVVVTRFGDLKNDVRSKPEWAATFTAAELNAFFREALSVDGTLAGVLPDGLTDPRVNVEGDRLRIAARYGSGFWSTVLSVELRAWLVKPEPDEVEPNTVALELVGMWAGGLPIGTQSVLDTISEAARESNVVVTWFRTAGHPVGVFRFYADQPRPTTQIRRLKIADGRVTVAGRSMLDPQGVAATVRDPE